MFTISRQRTFFKIISVSQINARHHFLARFIGTFPEEDVSYNKANEVQLAVTVTTCMCCVLEFGFYFLYNRMVNNEMFKNLTSHKISLGPSLAPYHLWRCSRDQRRRGFEEEGGRRQREEKEGGKKEEETRKEKRRKKEGRNEEPEGEGTSRRGNDDERNR